MKASAYGWIDGEGIGPEFLGHITETGRRIGSLTEYVDSAKTTERADLFASREFRRSCTFLE